MTALASFALEGKIVLVTGAGRGIGRSIALDAARSGASVAVGSRTIEEVQVVAAEIEKSSGASLARRLDVISISSMEAFVSDVLQRFGRVDILINNAGTNRLMPALEYDEDTFDWIVETNLKSVFFMSQIVARAMIAGGRGGSIVNISSQAGVVGAPDRAPYSGAKAGVNNLTRTLAAEWAEHHIRVNAVAPTVTRSALAEQGMRDSQSFAEAVKSKNLLRRGLAEPEEISAPVIFLASEAASMITGHTLVVDGGWTIV